MFHVHDITLKKTNHHIFTQVLQDDESDDEQDLIHYPPLPPPPPPPQQQQQLLPLLSPPPPPPPLPPQQQQQRHGDCVRCLATSEYVANGLPLGYPKSHCAAWALENNSVHVWRYDNWSRMSCAVLRGHEGPIHSVAITEDGRFVLSGSSDRTVRVWRVNTTCNDGSGGELLRTLQGHQDRVTSVAFAGSRQVVSGSADSTVRVWQTGGSLSLRDQHGIACTHMVLRGHKAGVTSVAVSNDATKSCIASGSHDKTVRLWNTADGSQRHVLLGHAGSVNSVAFLVCKNGPNVVSGSSDHTLRLWGIDGTSGPVLYGHTGPVSSIAVFDLSKEAKVQSGVSNNHGHPSPESRWISLRIVSGSSDNTVRSWGSRSFAEPDFVVKDVKLYPDSISSVALAPDGLSVFSSSMDAKAEGVIQKSIFTSFRVDL